MVDDAVGNKIKAVYALSGAPITFGHLNIIERVASTFDGLIVAIGMNPLKNYLFDLPMRIGLAEQCTKHLSNVVVMPFDGLLVDFAYEQNAKIIVKGVRNSADFDYENLLHHVGESQHLGIDTHLLIAEQKFAHISSTAVKALQLEHGFIHEFVPMPVKAALEKQLSNQIIIGVTGTIAAGKSTLCEALVDEGGKQSIAVHNVDLDILAHELLSIDDAPYAQTLREDIVDSFGDEILEDGQICRPKLGRIVFNEVDKMQRLNSLMLKPLLLKIRRSIYRKQGLILLNAALLAEANMLDLCSNRVVMLEVDSQRQLARLKARGYDDDHAKKRVESQFSVDRKLDIVNEAVTAAKFGCWWRVNSDKAFDVKQRMAYI